MGLAEIGNHLCESAKSADWQNRRDTVQLTPGRVDEEFVSAENLRDLWGRKATIKGVVHFRPSGRVQLLEAQTLAPTESCDDIFAASPRLEETPLLFETHRIGESAIAEVRGQWPGDESIHDLPEALRDD